MAESEEPDFSKLSLEDKLTHKVWKARVLGYEEAVKLFKRLDDENNPEYSKYVGLLKKFVTDSNAIAQEKALEATLVFVEYAACAAKVCADVVAGIVAKCLNARAKTKEAAISVCLMYIEIEKQEIVQEEIMKGFTHKQPKIVAACVGVLTRGLREFGSSVINIKPLLKSLRGLFEHSDKNVRAEAKAFALEIYRWIGPTLTTLIKDKVKPVQLKELEEEIDKLPQEKVKPTRLLRSQQAQAQPSTAGDGDAEEGEEDEQDEDDDVGGGAQMDAYDLLPAVNVLGQLPADFEENITHTKWQQRKEALETLVKLTGNPKLEPGEYGELMRMLKKVVSKDTNVMLVALAGKAVADLAKGLRKNFYPYASVMLTAIFEKFKEKKLNVVTALREAADAIYLTTSMSNIQEELVTAMANKNPAARSETLLFMARSFQLCTPDMLSKPFLKALCPIIISQLGDTTPQVRDASAEAFATVWKVMGDRPMASYIEGIDKTKMTKIEEFKEKVEIKAVVPKASKPKKAAATASTKASKKPAASAAATPDEPVKEPVKKPVKKKPPVKAKEPTEDSEAPPAKEPPAKKPVKPKAAAASGGGSKPASAKSKGKGKGAAANAVDAIEIPSEPNIANEEVEDKAKEVLPASLLAQLANSNWKERLAACEEFQKLLEGMEPSKIQSLLFVKVLGLKPGWKDSNFQVMKAKFSLVSVMVTTSAVFGKRSTACVLPVIVDKLADIKIKPQSIDTLMTMAEKFGLNFISTQVMKHAFEQKSPKVQSESLDWLSQAIKDFGFRIDVKSHIDSVKKGLGATNPTVRSAGITLLGVMHMYIGPQLRMFFEGEKSALLAQIDAEFEKRAGESPPAPTRGMAATTGEEEDEDDIEEASPSKGGAAPKPQSLADIMPKVDISGQIKSSLVKELADKNWKVRGEALQKVAEILKEAKFIEPSLGDLPGALKGRLSDANKNLVVTTLNILSTIANAMGSNCVKFVKVLMPGTIGVLSDSKAHVRQAATDTLNAWLEQTGLTCFVEGELLSTALATDNPYLRADLYKWLSEKLPEAGKLPSELSAVVAPVFASLEDRSPDVRKAAQLVLPPLTQHIGYDTMIKQTGKLKPASKQVVVGLLEKHKPTAPPPKSKAASSKPAASKQPPSEATESTTTAPPAATAGKKGKASAKSKVSSDHSKSAGAADDSEGGAPLIMSSKNQRAKDDQNLKMLKWNFASPRGEHVDQLKEQFVPCANAMLRSQLFHSDFKYHLVALSTLTKCIEEHNSEIVANMDLILRWTTLRFFDTNTSVTLKCLEFLQSLFANLVTADYRMSDYEAYAFIPYLVLKVGDAKDPVRKGVRVLFGLLCCVYPPGKLFPYIVDGLKSKNSRQRSECLEELGLLIQNNGMAVCQPTPQKAVQVIAQQISDRDTNVRNAALNTLVIVYDNIGDTVYKYAGQISPKDSALLEERIKRSGKKPTAPTAAPVNQPQAKVPAEDKQHLKHPKHSQQRQPTPVQDEEVTASNGTKEEKAIPAEKTAPTTKLTGQTGMKPPTISVAPAGREEQATTAVESRPRVVTGPYNIDTSKYGKDSSIPTLNQGKWKDEHVDYTVIDDGTNGVQTSYATSQLLANPPKTLAQSPARMASTSAAINYVISQISNNNTAETALHQMETYLKNADSTPSLLSHIDQLLRAVLLQLKVTLQSVTQQSHGKEAEEKAMLLIKQLLSCIFLVFTEGSLAVGASQDVLEEVQQQIMSYLLEDRLNKLEEVAQIHRTFNLIMSRMLENSNKNYLFGSLLHFLSESLSAEGEPTPITQMIMKCLWKLTRKIPDMMGSINVEELFLDLDKFFTYYTTLAAVPKDETPFRTVKTIIYHIVNIIGTKCMEHMTLIPKPKESAFWQYTRKSIAKKRASGSSEDQQLLASPSHGVKSHSPSPDAKSRISRKPPETLKYSSLMSAKLPPGASKQLCDIFTAISSVERSKQGLLALHEFKKKYPEVDLTPIIQQNTKFLKGYIERGLKSIEQEKSGLPAHEHSNAEGVDEYTSRLHSIEQLRIKASHSMKINNWDKAGGSSIKPPGTSLPSQHMEKTGRENKVPHSVTTKSKEEEINPEATASSLNLMDVRKRLDKLKTKT